MNKKEYASTIKKTPFKYPIAKKIAKLMLEGKERNEVFQRCVIDNYIEIESEERRREITNVIIERLNSLDDCLLSEFYNGDIVTSKFVLVYAIAKTDALFFEFLFDVYREALVGDKHYISIDDFDLFFAAKGQANLTVAKWGEFTLKCLKKGYRNILVDSGMGIRERKNINVNRMLIHPAIEEHIMLLGDKKYIEALLGGE